MDAALITAIAALVAAPVTAAGALFGTRGANRAAREGQALTGYDNLTQRLAAERDKAERDEQAAEARAAAADTRAAAADLRSAALESEIARLRALVTQLGGTP
ncbi:hypothetical protein [Streptomyces sp. Midd1]|uniref:hypothetical protein n=1 Tax=Streptomyces sp. Midd3 TaxID=3161191 RepID=UPI0034DB73F3